MRYHNSSQITIGKILAHQHILYYRGRLHYEPVYEREGLTAYQNVFRGLCVLCKTPDQRFRSHNLSPRHVLTVTVVKWK